MRVGVTGHRRVDHPDTVVAAIDAVIDGIGQSSDEPIEVWSSLAEGADRMVVSSALERRFATLVAVLPLPADDYSGDFGGEASRAEFGRLLTAATSVIVTGPDSGGTRQSAYQRAGLAVAESVDVLIAVWDGDASRGRGGTAEIVAAARDHGVDVIVVSATRAAAGA